MNDQAIAVSRPLPHAIVAIGYSAGGLVPLMQFFDTMPMDDCAYIVVPHLLPHVRTELQQILQRHSAMKIAVASHGQVIRSNCVYVLPPDSYMTIRNGVLLLQSRFGRYPNCAVDIFFGSLSRHKGTKNIAVIFSGTGKDGTAGIISVKRSGGLVIVQDPRSCDFPDMPDNAIRTGQVDYVLLPREMPDVIRQN